jgi:hypothetical protein
MDQQTKYLRSRTDGTVYIWTETLAARDDMAPFDGAPPAVSAVQQHLTVAQKVAFGLPLSAEDKAAYPQYLDYTPPEMAKRQEQMGMPPPSSAQMEKLSLKPAQRK